MSGHLTERTTDELHVLAIRSLYIQLITGATPYPDQTADALATLMSIRPIRAIPKPSDN